MTPYYGYLADLTVALHVGYVAYVVLGQLAILAAGSYRAKWGRNPWFRFTHLAAMGIVAVEAVMNWRCPLTVWEEQLRALAGQVATTGDTFMGRMLHKLLFIKGMPEVFFTTLYLAMMVVVAESVLLYPPRWFRLRRGEAV